MESGLASNAKQVNHSWRLLYAGVIFFIQLAYGINVGVVGPIMVDLGYIYDSAYLINTYMIMLTALGYLVGSLVGNLYRWLNRQLVLLVSQLFTSLVIALFPFYGTVSVFLTMAGMCMLGSGAWDSSVPSWLVELWPERSATLILINLFMQGLGNTIAPIIMSSYVHGENTANHTVSVEQRKHSLIVPSSLFATISTVASFCLLLLYIIKPYRREDYGSTEKEHAGARNVEGEVRPVAYRKTKAAILAICFCTFGTCDAIYMFFYPTMLQYLKYTSPAVYFSAGEASRLAAMMLGTITASRLVSSFIALKVSPDKLLVWHYSVTIGALALTYFGHGNKTIIYVGTIAIGYGYSALWASILSFTERYIHLTPRINSLFTFLLGFCTLAAPQVLGPLLKQHPLVLFQAGALLICISISCFIGASTLIYFTRASGRNNNSNTDNQS